MPFNAQVKVGENILASSYHDERDQGFLEEFTLYLEVERPILVFIKSKPTLLDLILKIGGLFGFLKLLSMIVEALHYWMFVRDLEKAYGT